MSTHALFVSGPLDGERRVLPGGCRQSGCYECLESPEMVDLAPFDGPVDIEVARVMYVRHIICGTELWAPAGMRVEDVVRHLAEGYGFDPDLE